MRQACSPFTLCSLCAAPPSPPRNIRIIEVFKDYVTIGWDAPERDGGDAVTGYEIEKSLQGKMFVTAGRTDANVSWDAKRLQIIGLLTSMNHIVHPERGSCLFCGP